MTNLPDSVSPRALAHPPPPEPEPEAPAEAASWSQRVEELLIAAAALCAEHDVDPDAFMHAAWTACLDSRPGLREQIADAQLTAQVENLRARGQVGSA